MGKRPTKDGSGKPLSGPVIPFGAEISYKPISPKDKDRLHQFGITVLSGIFIGYALQTGGGWTGDLLLIDWEDVENAESFRDIYVKRFKAQEVNVLQTNGTFRFPCADGSLKQSGKILPNPLRRKTQPPKQSISSAEGDLSHLEKEEE